MACLAEKKTEFETRFVFICQGEKYDFTSVICPFVCLPVKNVIKLGREVDERRTVLVQLWITFFNIGRTDIGGNLQSAS